MSTITERQLEDAFRALEGAARRDGVLAGEFEATRRGFEGAGPASGPGGAGGSAGGSAADRRHAEWFLLQRPSESLGGVPVEALRESWLDPAEGDAEATLQAFFGSKASAFEVTSVEARTVWLHDLFGQGEHPIDEPAGAAEIAAGDLVVGRIFPVGEGLFRLSRAASCFRDPALLEALRRDVEASRASRRGVLRIQQSELERLFFGGKRGAEPTRGTTASAPPASTGSPASTPPQPSREEALAAAREELLRLGLAPARVAGDLEALVEAAAQGRGDGATEVLNAWAFDTRIDLEAAQRIVGGLWSALRSPSNGPGMPVAPPAGRKSAAEKPTNGPVDVGEALSNFDRGKAAGRDLEELFRELEADLELEVDDEGDEAIAPDFPGVVGAVVEEYLWETGRSEPERAERDRRPLRMLADYASDVGVFEALDARRLLDFAGRWLLDEARLDSAAAAREVFDALARFCRWCEEAHAHELWSSFEATWNELARSVPRLVETRGTLAPGDRSRAEPFDVAAIEGERLTLRDSHGTEHQVAVEARVASGLRPGDFVRAVRSPDGESARIAVCYPGALRGLLAG